MDNTKMNMDSRLVKSWESAYFEVQHSETLWGGQPIPYLDKIVDIFQSTGSAVVLDFPCGDGKNTFLLAEKFELVVAADSSSSALHMLNKKANNMHIKNMVPVETNLFASCFVSNFFDSILCWDVLGHMEEPQKAIVELIRILKPNGKIVCSFFSHTEPCVADDNMIKINESDYRYKNDYFYRLYTREMLDAFLQQFASVKVANIEHVIWQEPPHEGFREYVHEHHSWAVTLVKEEI